MILHQLFFTGVNTFTNTNLEMSVLIGREKRSVRVYVCSSQISLRGRRLEVVGERENRRARGRHARGE